MNDSVSSSYEPLCHCWLSLHSPLAFEIFRAHQNLTFDLFLRFPLHILQLKDHYCRSVIHILQQEIDISLFSSITRLLVFSEYGIRYPDKLVIRNHGTVLLLNLVDMLKDCCRDLQLKILLDTFISSRCQFAQHLYPYVQADFFLGRPPSCVYYFCAMLRILPDESHLCLPPEYILCAFDLDIPYLDSAHSSNKANANPSLLQYQSGKVQSATRAANSIMGHKELPLSDPSEGSTPVLCHQLHLPDSTLKPAAQTCHYPHGS